MNGMLKHLRGAYDEGLPDACEHPESSAYLFYSVGRREPACPSCVVAFTASVVRAPLVLTLNSDNGIWTTGLETAKDVVGLLDPFDPLTVVLRRTLEAL